MSSEIENLKCIIQKQNKIIVQQHDNIKELNIEVKKIKSKLDCRIDSIHNIYQLLEKRIDHIESIHKTDQLVEKQIGFIELNINYIKDTIQYNKKIIEEQLEFMKESNEKKYNYFEKYTEKINELNQINNKLTKLMHETVEKKINSVMDVLQNQQKIINTMNDTTDVKYQTNKNTFYIFDPIN